MQEAAAIACCRESAGNRTNPTIFPLHNQSLASWRKKKKKSSMQIASWFRVIELVLHWIPTCTDFFVISVQQLPSFPANLLVVVMWRRQPSFSASRSLLRSACSNRYHQSLSLPFDRKYVHCVRGEEDEGEAKREIIKQICEISLGFKKKTVSLIGRPLLKSNHPIRSL